MKWFHYVACFFAGFFLIHLIPHLTHGVTVGNAIGATISLVVGCLLLWAGKASVKRPWTLVWVLAGNDGCAHLWRILCQPRAQTSPRAWSGDVDLRPHTLRGGPGSTPVTVSSGRCRNMLREKLRRAP